MSNLESLTIGNITIKSNIFAHITQKDTYASAVITSSSMKNFELKNNNVLESILDQFKVGNSTLGQLKQKQQQILPPDDQQYVNNFVDALVRIIPKRPTWKGLQGQMAINVRKDVETIVGKAAKFVWITHDFNEDSKKLMDSLYNI